VLSNEKLQLKQYLTLYNPGVITDHQALHPMTLRSGHRVSVPVTQDYHKKMKPFLCLVLHDIHKKAGVFTVGQTLGLGTCNLRVLVPDCCQPFTKCVSECSHLLQYFLTTRTV